MIIPYSDDNYFINWLSTLKLTMQPLVFGFSIFSLLSFIFFVIQ